MPIAFGNAAVTVGTRAGRRKCVNKLYRLDLLARKRQVLKRRLHLKLPVLHRHGKAGKTHHTGKCYDTD